MSSPEGVVSEEPDPAVQQLEAVRQSLADVDWHQVDGMTAAEAAALDQRLAEAERDTRGGGSA